MCVDGVVWLFDVVVCLLCVGVLLCVVGRSCAFVFAVVCCCASAGAQTQQRQDETRTARRRANKNKNNKNMRTGTGGTSPRKIADMITLKNGSIALTVCVNETATLPSETLVSTLPRTWMTASGTIDLSCFGGVALYWLLLHGGACCRCVVVSLCVWRRAIPS